MEIRKPEWLETVIDGKAVYGLDQEWYRTRFKKLAGCGPTVAATLLMYVNRREGGPLDYDNSSIQSALKMLNDVWKYVRPGVHGLHKVERFAKGVDALCGHYGADWRCLYIKVGKGAQPEEVAGFIGEGISADCPVAFLNLHAGEATAFDTWHWVTLTGIRKENGLFIVSGLDGGRQIEFDLAAWLKSTEAGGGFAYIAG